MPLRSSGSSGSPQAGRRGTIIVEDVVSSRMIDDEDHERVHDRVAAIGRGEGRRGGVHPDLAAFMVDRVGAANISTSRWPSAWMGTKHPIALGGSTLNRTRSTTCLTT
jgi:hypothetical protein